MTDIPNCENCPKFSYVEKDVNSGKLCRACGCPQDQVLKLPTCDGNVEQYNQMITKKHGCLDHPGAREWLMKDILEEIDKRGQKATDNREWEVSAVYAEAIALIRDGVK